MSSVTIEGLDRLQKTIKELIEATNPNAVVARITTIIGNAARRSLKNEQSALTGAKWQPLSEAYAKRKEKKWGKRRILERDRNLSKIISRKVGEGERVIGTTAKSAKGYPYPAVHQFGSDNGLIPARPFLPFDKDYDLAPSVADEIDKSLQATLKRVLEGKKTAI
jgi:phage gpG-like protein